MALGWKCLSILGVGYVLANFYQMYTGFHYGPVVSALLRKHSAKAKKDVFEITDRKREYFEIDTSQYMNYDFHDLGHEYHVNHGP